MRFRLTFLSIIALVLVSADVMAQRPGGEGGRRGFGRRGGRGAPTVMSLLRVGAVQKELDLSADQLTKIRDVAVELRGGDRPRGRQNNQDLSREERRERREQREKAASEMAAKTNEALKGVLNDEQFARLQQIFVQVAGTRALSDKSVAEKLDLSADQVAEIESKRADAMSGMRELFQSGDRDSIRAKMAEMRKKADDSVLTVLTEQQQQAFAAMKGAAFDMPEGALFGGRGGGRGGNRGDRPDRPRRPE